MVGEHDAAIAGGEAGFVLEFAVGDAGFPIVARGIGLDGELAVEPVLDFAVLDDDFAFVPFAGGFHDFVFGGLFDVVEAGGGAVAAFEGVGVFGVVDHLVFDAEPFLAVDLGDPILDAVVAAGGDLPFPLQFEVGVFLLGEEVSAFAGEMDGAVFFGGPAGLRRAATGVGEILEGEGGRDRRRTQCRRRTGG